MCSAYSIQGPFDQVACLFVLRLVSKRQRGFKVSGALEVGGFHRIADGPSEGRWSWGAGIGSANGASLRPDTRLTPTSAER